MFTKVLIYCLIAYGLTLLLVKGRGPFNIIGFFRDVMAAISKDFGLMFDCMLCTGTNVGLILSIIDVCVPAIAFTPASLILGTYWWLIIPFDMFLTGGVAWFINSVETWFGEKEYIIRGEHEGEMDGEPGIKELLND